MPTVNPFLASKGRRTKTYQFLTAALSGLQKVFERDSLEGLFTLAADKYDTDDSLTLRYWQGLAEQYLTKLCHIRKRPGKCILSLRRDFGILMFVIVILLETGAGDYGCQNRYTYP
jgi:hypothetical protein